MSTTDPFELALLFLQNNPSSNEAMKQLKAGTEIKLNFDDQFDAALFYHEDSAKLEKRAPQKYDVEFVLSAEAIRQLSSKENLTVAETGIEFLKLTLLNHIEIKKHGTVINFISNGYMKIVKLAGPEFLSFLASHGFGSIQKIVNYIRK